MFLVDHTIRIFSFNNNHSRKINLKHICMHYVWYVTSKVVCIQKNPYLTFSKIWMYSKFRESTLHILLSGVTILLSFISLRRITWNVGHQNLTAIPTGRCDSLDTKCVFTWNNFWQAYIMDGVVSHVPKCKQIGYRKLHHRKRCLHSTDWLQF